jgi:hypothetical protein
MKFPKRQGLSLLYCSNFNYSIADFAVQQVLDLVVPMGFDLVVLLDAAPLYILNLKQTLNEWGYFKYI